MDPETNAGPADATASPGPRLPEQLRVLMVEDSEHDAALLLRELGRGGYDLVYQRVETAEGMRAALHADQWDVILCDYRLPIFGALAAVEVARQSGRDIPFIVVSGTVDEETAVEALKAGAHDFVVKHRLARLLPAISREIREASVRRERRQAMDDLKLAVKARDEFLSIASHELKTPLTTLELQVGSALQLLRGPLPHGDGMRDKVSAKLQTASRQIDRLNALINNLLDVTRITSGRLALERQPTDLGQLARTVVARLQDLFLANKTPLVLSAADGVVGHWDPLVVETIANNLLSNAMKFGREKPVEVDVSAEGDLARLVVADHGIGIEPDAQERVFQRFERAVPEHHYGGFGLGLWVARQAAEAHGGRIRVSSSPGAGSTFIVELPRGAG